MFFFFFIYIFFIRLECFIRTSLYFFMIKAKASNKKTTTAKTLRKREKEFQLKLDFDINIEYKVCCIWCSDCKKWKPRIKRDQKVFKQMDQRDRKCSKTYHRKTCQRRNTFTSCKAFKTKWTRCGSVSRWICHLQKVF